MSRNFHMHAPHLPAISPEILLAAYRSGIFPMAEHRDDPDIFWVEPRERAIIPLGGFRCSRSTRKILSRDRYKVTIDLAFDEVVAQCSAPRDDKGDSWISGRIARSYGDLHRIGHAHSLECWDGAVLLGGLYGVSFDRVFCGESMFSRASNASKVALSWLVALMRRAGYGVLDCQFTTAHLRSLGAVEIPQASYMALIAANAQPAHMTLKTAYDSVCEEASRDGSSPGKRIAQSLTQTS